MRFDVRAAVDGEEAVTFPPKSMRQQETPIAIVSGVSGKRRHGSAIKPNVSSEWATTTVCPSFKGCP